MLFFEKNEIVKRLKKYPILNQFSETSLRQVVEASSVIEIPANQVLFYYEDPSDFVYYVVDGHLEGFSSNDLVKKVVDIHRGEMVGEMGVVSNEPYHLTVKSHRPSQILKIKREVFLQLFQQNTELLMTLTQTMAKRLRNLILDLQDKHYPYKNIGLIVLSPELSLGPLKEAIHAQIALDSIHFYEKNDFVKTTLDIVPFLYQCEDNAGINIFLAEKKDTPWTKAILEYSDYMYLLVHENAFEALDKDILESLNGCPCDIAIFHEKHSPFTLTSQWYTSYPFKRHHHLQSTLADYQRLYRYMTGQAIGLVISGGGFRGYAHYGLVKALCEAKIPVDCFAGSSIGAGIAALLALRFDWPHFDALFQEVMKRLKDTRPIAHITVPIISILSGKVATEILMEYFNYAIEDLPLNFFCVTGNLSEGTKNIKKTGLLWEWLRASMAIPGILPPFEKEGAVYVDGGVCTNLPVPEMRDYLDNAGKIIAFDISIPPFRRKNYFFPPVLTFKELLAYKFGLKKHQYIFPRLVDLLLESFFLSQSQYDIQSAKKSDILVTADTSLVNSRDIKQAESLSLLSYELAKEKLQEHKATFERWII